MSKTVMPIAIFVRSAIFAIPVFGVQFPAVSQDSITAPAAHAFEGVINAVMTKGDQTEALLYTVGTNFLRVEKTATNWPNPVDIFDLNSGGLTLLFPNNRSFIRLKPVTENSSVPPGFPQMPGVGPQSQATPSPPGEIGPTNLPGMPALPQPPGVGPQPGHPAPRPQMSMAGGMPALPPPMMERMDLKATGEKTNLLGFACEKLDLKQRGETMEIWATDKLFPFQPYVQNQSRRFGPRLMEEEWGELLTIKKLFPLRAVLHYDNGMERFRFEITSVKPRKLTDEDAKLFQPPFGYFEIQPLPF